MSEDVSPNESRFPTTVAYENDLGSDFGFHSSDLALFSARSSWFVSIFEAKSQKACDIEPFEGELLHTLESYRRTLLRHLALILHANTNDH